jgi:hypothetical protein
VGDCVRVVGRGQLRLLRAAGSQLQRKHFNSTALTRRLYAFPVDNWSNWFILEIQLDHTRQALDTKKRSKVLVVLIPHCSCPAPLDRCPRHVQRRSWHVFRSERRPRPDTGNCALSQSAFSASLTYTISLYPSYESRR